MREDPYAKIIAALVRPMTSQELAGAIRMKNGGHVAMLYRLMTIGAVERIKPAGSRWFLYSRVWDTVTRKQVEVLIKEHKEKENYVSPHARLISFETEDMKKKLQENDKLNRKKRGKIYVAAHWPMND